MNTISEGTLCPDSNQSNATSHILTADELEQLVNYIDHEPIKTAIKALFKKGDIIEVRAWNKQHEVYTGRYKYGTLLVKAIELFNEECDVYYVLNPVGNKHGERTMMKGGLCAWEQDIPWRRRFLLDFDPHRDNKIATHAQWLEACNAAYRAKVWLETLGFKGIILASSGNGCHLDVPCELPNDTASKEIVRKVQRIVADKFSTPEVECECFPDANRLVRAYGSTNKKGTATSDTPYRQSEILMPPSGVDEDPKSILLQMIAANPMPETKAKNLGSGAGPFSRDLLYARLEAWQDNWEGENGEEFLFEETDRNDGFRILCPGNTEMAWPDGEQHETVGEPLNDSCIVYVENGWPRFSCRHNHCGEGAAHGKKTWKDLQEFYDKERAYHRIIDETDYSAKWMLDYVDDGIEDKGTADVESLLQDEVIQVEVVNAGTKLCDDGVVRFSEDRFAKAEPTATVETPAAEESVVISKNKLYEMPDDCMYGWLGDAARELETPLGFAYPSVLTVWASQIQVFPKHIRPTLYTCLIGPVHSGKSETIKRAEEYIHIFDPTTVSWTVPGSDRGLIKQFGLLPDKDDKNKTPAGAKTKLLLQDELRNTLSKINITGSSLPSTLCTLWSREEAGASDKTGVHEALVRLNILGALKCDDGEDFAETFGKGSTTGLYDRFVYGLAPKGWRFNKWERLPVVRAPKGGTIPDYCFHMIAEWREVDPVGRGRLAEIALRIAYITSSANHDDTVTVKAMEAALKFVRWQEVIRVNYKAGLGDGSDSLATAAILGVLEKLEPGVWIHWKKIALGKNWYRKHGARVLAGVRDSLFRSGITIEETVDDENGKPKRTGRLRLRCEKDDRVAAIVGED